MKEFRCDRCGAYLGEMSQGKVKLGSVMLCKGCLEKYKTFESLGNYKDATGGGVGENIFNDLFGQFGKK